MITMDIIYPAAGLVTLLGSVLGLKLLDRMSGSLPKRIVAALARPALLQASELSASGRAGAKG
ncbi:MAG: hypothetical protein ABIL58_27370 [Pseudomonadota bacterium]